MGRDYTQVPPIRLRPENAAAPGQVDYIELEFLFIAPLAYRYHQRTEPHV